MEETIQNLAKLRKEFKSNWYIREPIYDSSVRAKKSYEGYILGIFAISFFVIPLAVGIVGKF